MQPLHAIVGEMRDAAGHLLVSAGFNVLSTMTYCEAAQLVRSHPCDLLVVEVSITNCASIDFIGELRRTDGTVRIIAMAHRDEPAECLQLARTLGAHATIKQPFTRDEFFRAVGEALDHSTQTETSAPLPSELELCALSPAAGMCLAAS